MKTITWLIIAAAMIAAVSLTLSFPVIAVQAVAAYVIMNRLLDVAEWGLGKLAVANGEVAA